MLTKGLFIGVGGSGGGTLRFLWDELESRLRSYGWTEGIPDAWQFLHIDAPQLVEQGQGDIARELHDPEHYLGLAKTGVKFSTYTRTLNDDVEVLAGWRPDPTHDWGPVWLGAGQRRAVGRVIAMANLSDVGERLDQAILKMSGDEASSQLNRLATLMGQEAVSKAAPVVALISSLGGGAGAGMLLDISLLLRGHASADNEFLNHHFTVLYPADIFSTLPAEARTGIAPNTLAGFSELISANQHEGKMSAGEDRVLNRAGSVQTVTGNRTADVNFIMGSRNSEIVLSSPNDIFRATARGLAAFLTNPQIGLFLTDTVIINHTAFSSPVELMAESRRDVNSTDVQVGSSFAYAAVSLGRRAFTEYGSERIARALTLSLSQSDADLQQRLLRHRDEVESGARDFAHRCGLLERDAVDESGAKVINDEVLDALRDHSGIVARTKSLEAAIIERFAKKGDETKKWKSDQWQKNLREDFQGDSPKIETDVQNDLSGRAKRWVEIVRTALLNETVRSIALVGLPETLFYLKQLDDDLSEANEQLVNKNAEITNNSAALSADTNKIFDALDKVESLTMNSSKPTQFLANLRKIFSQRLEVDSRTMAHDLIIDFVADFVRPLTDEIERAREEFVGSFNELANHSLFQSWSSGPVALRLYPAPNERYLLDVDGDEGFESSFNELLIKQLHQSSSGDALVAASAEVIGGFDAKTGGNWSTAQFDAKGQVRITETDRWIPKNRDLRADESSVAKKARFSLHFSLDELLEDARTWMNTRTGVAEFTNETMASYLNDETAKDGSTRRRKFVNELKVAVAMSEPMVNFNTEALRYFHGEEEVKSVPSIGQIPMNPAFDEAADVKNLLVNAGFQPHVVDNLFNSNAPGSEVEIARFIMTFVHPVVMDSIMKPIAQEWARESSADKSRKEFWVCRRARTLPSFIPLAPSVQKEMAKGWQIARLLGYISDACITAYHDSSGKTAISISSQTGVLKFPTPLLDPDVNDTRNFFAALMESFMLAFLDVSSGDVEALEAYKMLGRLGKESKSVLGSWINSGVVSMTKATITPDPKVAGTAAGTAVERAAALTQQLTSRLETIESKLNSIAVEDANFDQFSRAWELRDVMATSIEELLLDISSGTPAFDPSEK